MKATLTLFFMLIVAASVISCSEDEVKVKGDADLVHEGEKWNIASVEYTLIDQSMSGQTYKSGTKQNAGSFYFVPGGDKGSFEMNIEGYNKEDAFNYTNDNGSISIITIEQSVGAKTNQNVLVISGEASDTEMSLDGTITKQSTSGQFILTVTGMTIVKQ